MGSAESRDTLRQAPPARRAALHVLQGPTPAHQVGGCALSSQTHWSVLCKRGGLAFSRVRASQASGVAISPYGLPTLQHPNIVPACAAGSMRSCRLEWLNTDMLCYRLSLHLRSSVCASLLPLLLSRLCVSAPYFLRLSAAVSDCSLSRLSKI